MPTITSLKQQNKKERFNVFIDGEFAFSVSIDAVIKYRLKEGLLLSNTQIQEITQEEEKNYAFSLGLKYINKAFKTKKQVKTYLISKEISYNSVKFAIEKLTDLGYLNDVEYAKQYIETYSNSQGKRMVDYKLMMKGVNKEDIESAYTSIEIPSKENAKLIAEKRLKNKEINRENILKTYRYIVSKGFSFEEAEYAVKEFKEQL